MQPRHEFSGQWFQLHVHLPAALLYLPDVSNAVVSIRVGPQKHRHETGCFFGLDGNK